MTDIRLDVHHTSMADLVSIPELARGGGRVLSPRARALADEILSGPHVSSLDRIAAEELGSLVALVEGLDREIAAGGGTSRDRRTLIKLRILASRRLESWTAAMGMTPRDRAELLRTSLAGRALVADFSRRRSELDDG
jgi:hypothetical protein